MKAQDITLEENLFNRVATGGARNYLSISEYNQIYRQINLLDSGFKPIMPGARLLEFGCNDGLHCLNLSRLGYKTEGFDVAGGAICLARNEAARLGLAAKFYLADANKLSCFSGSSFDIILMFGFLHHFYFSGNMLEILKEADRIVSKGGKIFIVEPNHLYPYHFLAYTLAHILLKIYPFNFLKDTFTLNERSLKPSGVIKLVLANLDWKLEKVAYFDYVKKIISRNGYEGNYLLFLIKRVIDAAVSILKPELKSDYFCLMFTKP